MMESTLYNSLVLCLLYVALTQWFSTGTYFASPRDTWQCLETFGCWNLGASSRQRPDAVQHPTMPRTAPQNKKIQPKMAIVPRIRNPALVLPFIQKSSQRYAWERSRENGYTCMCGWTSLSTWNYRNIVNQLRFNIKLEAEKIFQPLALSIHMISKWALYVLGEKYLCGLKWEPCQNFSSKAVDTFILTPKWSLSRSEQGLQMGSTLSLLGLISLKTSQ